LRAVLRLPPLFLPIRHLPGPTLFPYTTLFRSIPDDCDPPKQLVVKDLVPGSGPAAAAGDQLTMNYSLVTWSDKQKLDSSFDRGEPFELTLGSGMVIPGWEQGLEGVQQGARRLLIIPPDLGYGAGGNGIKPNETLVFVTDAVDVPD